LFFKKGAKMKNKKLLFSLLGILIVILVSSFSIVRLTSKNDVKKVSESSSSKKTSSSSSQSSKKVESSSSSSISSSTADDSNKTGYEKEGESKEDYYIQQIAWLKKQGTDTGVGGYAAIHKNVAYMDKFGQVLFDDNSGLYFPAPDNHYAAGLMFLTSEYSTILMSVQTGLDDKGNNLFSVTLETRDINTNKLLNSYHVDQYNFDFAGMSDLDKWQYIYDHYPDFKYVEKSDGFSVDVFALDGKQINVGEQDSPILIDHQDFINSAMNAFHN
jgi:hypothetical protein